MRTIPRSIVGLAPFLLLLVFSTNRADACSCMVSGPPCQAYWRSDVIFAGTVTGIASKSVKETFGDNREYWRTMRVVSFAVENTYKGTKNSYVEVLTGAGGGDCGYQFSRGGRYMVYADRDKDDGLLYTGICSRTRTLESAAEDIEYFKNIPAPGTGASITGKVTLSTASLKNQDGRLEVKELEGVRISAVSVSGGGRTFEAVTNSTGRFSMSGVPPGKYKVTADLAEGVSNYRTSEVELVDRGCAGVDFWASENGQVSGKVVDANGNPVQGVRVDIIPKDEAYSAKPLGKWGFTQNDGTFQIESLPSGKYLLGLNLTVSENSDCPVVRAYYPGFADPEQASAIDLGAGQKLKDLVIRMPAPLRPRRTITGTVVWPDGSPAVHAAIGLSNAEGHAYSVGGQKAVDDKGRFTFEVTEGCKYLAYAYTFGVTVNGKQEEMRHAEPLEFTVTGDTPQPIRLVLTSRGFQHREDEDKQNR